MNGDLISRGALTERIVDLLVFEWGYEGVEASVKRIFSEIPAVDAVKVVRCKDCKFRCETDDGEYNPEDIVCTYWATDGLKACNFCSYGERRADDD